MWQPTPVFLSGEPHGQRSLAGHSPLGRKESDRTELLSTHCLGLPLKGRLQTRGSHLPSSRGPGSPPSEGASLTLQVCADAGYLLLRLLLSEDLHILNLLVGWGCSLLCFLILLACGVEERCGGPLHGLFPLRLLLTELWPRAEMASVLFPGWEPRAGLL